MIFPFFPLFGCFLEAPYRPISPHRLQLVVEVVTRLVKQSLQPEVRFRGDGISTVCVGQLCVCGSENDALAIQIMNDTMMGS